MRVSRFPLVGGLVAALLTALLLCGGCPSKRPAQSEHATTPPTPKKVQKAATPEKVTLGLVSNAVSPFWDPMKVGMEDAVKEINGSGGNVEASWQGPPNATWAEQKRILENFAANNVDGISVSPTDAKAIADVINELSDQGIKVICMDSDCPQSKRLAYIGTNNYEAGKKLGEKACELLPKGGKAIAFVGKMAVQNSQDRVSGLRDALKAGGIELLDVMQDQADKNKARKNVEDVIQAHPDIDALIGIWSYNLPAIAAAVKDSGKRSQIKVLGFDAEPLTLKGLEEGDIDATIVQKPYEFGYRSVKLLYALITGDQETVDSMLPESKIIDTGAELITPDNVADYRKRLEKLGIRSS